MRASLLWLARYVGLGVVLVGCGGGSGGAKSVSAGDQDSALDPSEQTVSGMQGNVVIEERSGRYYLDAWFSVDTSTAGTPGAPPELLYTSHGETCERVNTAAIDPAAEPPLVTVSAGESLELITRAGVWAQLALQSGWGMPVYASELRSIRQAWPEDVMLDVPGDDFPAVASTALDPLAPLALVAPVDSRSIPDDGKLVWEASIDERDLITLVLREERVAPNEASDTRFSVICQLEDDGEFLVPDEVTEYVDWIARAARVRTTTVAAEDSVLTVVQVSER